MNLNYPVTIWRTMLLDNDFYNYWLNDAFIKEAENITYDTRDCIFKECGTLAVERHSSLHQQAIINSREHDEYMRGTHQSIVPKEQPKEVTMIRVLVNSES